MAKRSIIIYDDEYTEVRNRPKGNFGYFQSIGSITNMKYNNDSTDIFTYLRKVSKPAFEVFDDLKNQRDPLTNICWLPTKHLTDSQLKMFRSRIKELKDVEIIKKAKTWNKTQPIKTGSYMINPGLIKPKDDPLNLIDSAWEIL